jgi:BON domain
MGHKLCLVSLFTAIVFVLSAPLVGCRSNAHPDVQAKVYKVLDSHDFASVEVSQDRGAGVITLRGVVGSADRRSRAEELVREAAPGYTVKNQLQVQNSATAVPVSEASGELLESAGMATA